MNRSRFAAVAAIMIVIGVMVFATMPRTHQPDAAPEVAEILDRVVPTGPPEQMVAPDLGEIVANDDGVIIDRPDLAVDVPGDAEGIEDDDLVDQPDPFAAIEYTRNYYTIAATTPMAQHRASLRPYVTDEQFARITDDSQGLFDDSDAVRFAFTEDSVAQIRQHTVVSRDVDRADIAVVVDVLVTSNGMERTDSHLMVLTVLEPSAPGGRWLVDSVVIDPEDNGHGETFEFPDDSDEQSLPGVGEA